MEKYGVHQVMGVQVPASHDTYLDREVISMEFLAIWSSFHSLVSALWATLLYIYWKDLGFKAAQIRPNWLTSLASNLNGHMN